MTILWSLWNNRLQRLTLPQALTPWHKPMPGAHTHTILRTQSRADWCRAKVRSFPRIRVHLRSFTHSHRKGHTVNASIKHLIVASLLGFCLLRKQSQLWKTRNSTIAFLSDSLPDLTATQENVRFHTSVTVYVSKNWHNPNHNDFRQTRAYIK